MAHQHPPHVAVRVDEAGLRGVDVGQRELRVQALGALSAVQGGGAATGGHDLGTGSPGGGEDLEMV